MALTKIQTTTGTATPAELGRTLVHEHVLVGFPGWELDAKAPKFKRAEAMSRALDQMQELQGHGVGTFVDPCPIELGRDVRLLAEVSERSGMHIVCATGFYFEAMGIPPYWRHATVDEIADLYVREIEQGIDGTDIRAGLLKCSTGAPQISELERRCLTAASIAQRRTGG